MFEIECHGELPVGARELRIDVRSAARVIGVAGPTGVGKSTFLRYLCGHLQPERTTLKFREQIWQSPTEFVAPWQRSLGWVPQDALLLPHRTVLQNLMQGLSATQERAQQVAEDLSISKLLDRYPRHLSGGERQRVALGRALIGNNSLLLLDEPFSALDDEMQEQARLVITRWAGEFNSTIVLVTHRMAELGGWVEDLWQVHDDHIAGTLAQPNPE